MIICYFGDSLTLGYGDPSGLGWPGRVSGKLAALGVDITSYNLGVRKNSAPELAKRWKRELESRILSGLDIMLVFSFGVADVFTETELAETMAAAESILAEAKEFGEIETLMRLDKEKEKILAQLAKIQKQNFYSVVEHFKRHTV